MEPDVFAAHAYDGMNMIIKAIKSAGLNRVLDPGHSDRYENIPGI